MDSFAQKLLFGGGLVLAIILLGIAAWQFGWFSQAEATRLDAMTLIHAFAEDTGTAKQMFVGERVAVRGKVTKVNSAASRSFVVLGDIDHRNGIRCMFDGVRAAELMDVVVWQEIVVEGTVAGYREGAIVLEDCTVAYKEKTEQPF